jgi:hypothetical protein
MTQHYREKEFEEFKELQEFKEAEPWSAASLPPSPSLHRDGVARPKRDRHPRTLVRY